MKLSIQFFIVLFALIAKAQYTCVDYNGNAEIGYSVRLDLDRDGSFDVKIIADYDNAYGNAYVIHSLKPETGNYQNGNIRFRENYGGFVRNYDDGAAIPRLLGTIEQYDTLSIISYEASHGYKEFDEDNYPSGNIIYRKELGYTIDYSFGIPETIYSWCSGWLRIELLNGLDSIRVERSCGCLNEGMNAGQPTSGYTVDDTTSAIGDMLIGSVNVFPNPTESNVTVTFPSSVSKGTELNIFNSVGQLIRKEKVQIGQEAVELNLNDLPKGVYVLKVNEEHKQIAVKRIMLL